MTPWRPHDDPEMTPESVSSTMEIVEDGTMSVSQTQLHPIRGSKIEKSHSQRQICILKDHFELGFIPRRRSKLMYK